jgi:hypothetical protein
MEKAVRDLAGLAGVMVRELPEKNRCCGHGGHIRVANPALYDEIVRHRTEAGDQPYLVYCANCRDVFAWRGKECAHILDVALGLTADLSVPTLEQKRDNSLRVKKELVRQLEGAEFEPARRDWDDVTLSIPTEVQYQMEEKLISAADVKEAIWRAETTGEFFYDAGGTRVAGMVKRVFTYWVQYRQTAPNSYEVLAAYSHRMRLREGE